MRIFVVFPKPNCYVGKDIKDQRIYKERFLKYLSLVKEAGASVEILLEDKLANDMLFEAGIEPARVISCISTADISLLDKYRNIEDLDEYVYATYSTVQQCCYDAVSRYTVPITKLKEGKSAYFNAMVKNYRKRYNYALNRYISEFPNVLQFRTDNSMDRGSAVKTTVSEGDGRLCIEVNMSNGTVASYYGGLFITEDLLPSILSL